MLKNFIGGLLLFGLLFGPAGLWAQELVIENANLIDVEKGRVLLNTTVVIQGGQITEIGKAGKVNLPERSTTIDATGQWLLPGLVDGHVHFFQSGGLYTRPDIVDLRHLYPYEKERQWIEAHLDDLFQRYLQCGITTAFDMGGPMRNFAWREKAATHPTFPDLFVTGPLISTYQPEELLTDDPPIIKATSPEHARELVRQQLPHKPDYIKIWFIVEAGETVGQHLPVVNAVIDESRMHDLPVAVHATELETARAAVEAGASILVHSVDDQPVDADFIKLLKKKNVTYIPTLQVSFKYGEVLSQRIELHPGDFTHADPFVVSTLFDFNRHDIEEIPGWIRYLKRHPLTKSPEDSMKLANLKRVWDGGVNVVTGTDAGNIGTMHGSAYFTEIELMRQAGLSPLQILQASTINASRMLGAPKLTGTIEKGAPANLLLLEANPLDDLTHLRQLAWVIHRGHPIRPDTLFAGRPELVVQRQVNAYNARNREAFAACYADSITCYNFPDEQAIAGKEALRKSYGILFRNFPDLFTHITDYLVAGDRVVTYQPFSGFKGGAERKAILVYRIINGLIEEVYYWETEE